MIKREFLATLKRYAKEFPVVILTGARQTGKTTLVQTTFKRTHKYVLLEDPDLRQQAIIDCRSFLERYAPPVIFDEFQNVPELASYLQGIVDQRRNSAGQYILTGSQSFLMMEQVAQSLAGRAGVLSLYGLHSGEIPVAKGALSSETGIINSLMRGSFPELWARPKLEMTHWYSSYLLTYLERDVRKLTQVTDLATFERFVRLVAIRTGQLMNQSELGRECGVTAPTITRWLSILRATYQIHFVEPFFENLSSRIKKSPKIYMVDSGLASYLMGFKDPSVLLNAPQLGPLFETLVIMNLLKKRSVSGELPEHYFFQTKKGIEVDLMLRNKQNPSCWDIYEVKYTRTIREGHLKQLFQAKTLLKNKCGKMILLAPVREKFTLSGVEVMPWFLG